MHVFAAIHLPRQYSRLYLSCLTVGGLYYCTKEQLGIRRCRQMVTVRGHCVGAVTAYPIYRETLIHLQVVFSDVLSSPAHPFQLHILPALSNSQFHLVQVKTAMDGITAGRFCSGSGLRRKRRWSVEKITSAVLRIGAHQHLV
jgi:hypothetical protein